MIRAICEAYQKTPDEIVNLTLDQVYLITLPRQMLADVADGVNRMSTQDAVSAGIVPLEKAPSLYGQGKSLFQRIKERKVAERAQQATGCCVAETGLPMDKQSRREARMRQLRADRAKGVD